MAPVFAAFADELVVELVDDEADETQDGLVFIVGIDLSVVVVMATLGTTTELTAVVFVAAKFELDTLVAREVKLELDDLAEPLDGGVLLLCSMPLVEADERRRLDDESLLLPILLSLFMGASIWS